MTQSRREPYVINGSRQMKLLCEHLNKRKRKRIVEIRYRSMRGVVKEILSCFVVVVRPTFLFLGIFVIMVLGVGGFFFQKPRGQGCSYEI